MKILSRKSNLLAHKDISEIMSAETQAMLHELRVHQLELEMQNEELRRIQSELDTTKEHYYDLYDLAPVGYCSVSKTGLILQINLTAAILLDMTREKLVRQAFIRYIFNEDRDIFYLLSKRLFEFGDSQKCELRMIKKDGTHFWASLAATTVLQAGVVSELRIVLFDITERIHTQNELQISNVELENAKKNLEAANAKMLLYQQQLLGLVAHQQQIKEAERMCIAREIHDELGSVLTGIKANLSVAMHEDAMNGYAPNQRLVDACTLLDTAVDTVRKVIVELRPSVLDQLGVWTALEWYAEQVELRTGIRCHIHIDPQVQESNVDTESSTAFFRILQESLTNVTRHANASEVRIRVTLTDGVFAMEVADNGTGIDTTRMPDHQSWGIVGMVERARFLGGDLEIIDTSPGTLVKLRLPVKETDD